MASLSDVQTVHSGNATPGNGGPEPDGQAEPPPPRWDAAFAVPGEQDLREEAFLDAFRRASGVGFMPMLVAGGLTAAYWTSPYLLYVLSLLGASALFAAIGLLGARLEWWRHVSRTGRKFILVVAAISAGLLGVIWGAMPLVLFAPSDPDGRLLVLGSVVVLLTEVNRLASIRGAALAYVIPMCLGSVLGFALSNSEAGLALASAIPFYGALLVWRCSRAKAAAARHLGDRVSIAAQNRTIHELLLDFDETSSDWLWETDEQGAFEIKVKGTDTVPPGYKPGEKFDALLARARRGVVLQGTRTILTAFAARRPFRNQLVEVPLDETSRWWRLSGKPFYDADGRFIGYRGVGSDITHTLDTETRIAQLANHDTLTGFANRTNFRIHGERACMQALDDGRCGALLCLDIDGFKSVNDRLGHDGGDLLLRQVAERLTAVAPPGTFIARLDGDEFALWMQPTTPSKAQALARQLIETIGASYDVRGLQVDIGASIGIAFTPKHAMDPDDLLVKAELALYRAKVESKGQICVFAPALETSLIERRKLEVDLRLALARGEFTLHFQPIVDVAQGRVVSFESLIRWHSPDRGFVSPADFIPAAESTGLIVPIGRWVLFEACRTAASWPADVRVAVNISPPHLRAPSFLQDVALALKTSGLHPSRLEIEITEGVFLDKTIAALDMLRSLRTRGVRLALDDFGTGYSSFNYLKDFPVDKIKIDRSFISNLLEENASRAIVDTILQLANRLGIRVVAEGVETKEQAQALKLSQCDEFQGYLFSRPRPAVDVPDMLRTVPALFRAAVPTYMDSPLAKVLVTKKVSVA